LFNTRLHSEQKGYDLCICRTVKCHQQSA